MWGDANGIIVYGFKETSEQDAYIDYEWLEKWQVSSYGLYTVRDISCQPVYGVRVQLDTKEGKALLGEEDKAAVLQFAAALGREKDVRFHLCVSCGEGFHGREYIPEVNVPIPNKKQKMEEDEEEEEEEGDVEK